VPTIIATLLAIVLVTPIAVLLSVGYKVLPDRGAGLPSNWQGDIATWGMRVRVRRCSLTDPATAITVGISTISTVLFVPMQIITNRYVPRFHPQPS
jgi:hypothetical protein